MRFLVSRLSSLGDVVCSLPAAVALKRSFPGCEVVWCVDQRFAGVVSLCGSVDRCFVLPNAARERGPAVRALGEFDAAFDLQGLLKSGLVVGWARARRKLGYHWRREGAWLFSQRVRPEATSLHVTDQYVDVVRAFGAECERAEFDLRAPMEDVARMRAVVPCGDFVVCNAGAGWASKRWPAAHFAELSRKLGQMGLHAAFVGAAGEKEVFGEVAAHDAGDAIDLTGQTSLGELVALVSLAKAHVGGDTGSTHIAAALGVPAVGLYSVTRPERSCPYGQRASTLYDPRGLSHITVDQTVEALRGAIGQNV